MRKLALGFSAALALTVSACGTDQQESNVVAEDLDAAENLEVMPPIEPSVNNVVEEPVAEPPKSEPAKPAEAKPAPAKPKPEPTAETKPSTPECLPEHRAAGHC